MKVPFTWKVTGWFMIGWSAECPAGEVRPRRYFGEDLVAYRDEAGELHVMTGHCRHLGAHVGHGGTVVGDCVECPFHGWRWGPDGTNLFYSIWWPRVPGDASEVPPDKVREQVERQFLGTAWEDLDIWRYQEYVERPALSRTDAKPYMAMRKWASQFYEVPAAPPGELPPTRAVTWA